MGMFRARVTNHRITTNASKVILKGGLRAHTAMKSGDVEYVSPIWSIYLQSRRCVWVCKMLCKYHGNSHQMLCHNYKVLI